MSANDMFLDRRREHCERAIMAIEAVIEGRITADVEQLEISATGGAKRAIVKIPIPELIKMRQQYLAELDSLRAAEGIGKNCRRNVLVRF